MKAYWDSLTKEQQGELAGKVGSTPGYLRLVFNGYKKASFVLAKKLEQCTSGAITKSDLRPDTTRRGRRCWYEDELLGAHFNVYCLYYWWSCLVS